MLRTKIKSQSQVIGEEAVKLVKEVLPAEWTIREFNPDFGIDLDIELFDYEANGLSALGEHVFIQVKGTFRPDYKRVSFNGNLVDAIGFNLEVPELNLVERMGSAIPVLLVLVDIKNNKIYQICLNDYIKKVLPIQNPNYRKQKTVVIHIPISNILTKDDYSSIEWYGKRIKIYSMFHEMLADIQNFEYMGIDELLNYADCLIKQYMNYDLINQDIKFLEEIKEYIIKLQNNDFVTEESKEFVIRVIENKSNWKNETILDSGFMEINAYRYAQKLSILKLKEIIEFWSEMFEKYARERYMPILKDF